MGNPSYFGIKLGEALASGAEHINKALERRYAQEMEREKQLKAEQLAFGQAGVSIPQETIGNRTIGYAPESISPWVELHKRKMAIDEANKLAEINLLNARVAATGKKAPTGYEYTESGNLRAIPGGPAEQKIRQAKEKEYSAMSNDIRSLDIGLDTVNKALESVGMTTAGAMGWTRNIPMTPAKTLQGYLTTLKSKIGLSQLQQMRRDSPTGGAMGNVSDKDIELLTNSIAALDQSLDPKVLKQNLEYIKGTIQNWRNAAEHKLQNVDKYVESSITPQTGDKIRVRLKSTGQTGTIEANEFNDSEYERI